MCSVQRLGRKRLICRAVLLLGIALALGAYLAIRRQSASIPLIEAKLPKTAYVILHASTKSNAGEKNPLARSYFLYYDKEGTLLQTAREDEVHGGIFSETEDGVAIFLRNEVAYQTGNGTKKWENSSGRDIVSKKFGPSTVGWISGQKCSYALMNIGQKTADSAYINILRFVSEGGTYDVEIPYYLENVCYDAEGNRFLCQISSLMGTSAWIEYVVVAYDYGEGKFVYNDTVHKLHNPDLEENMEPTGNVEQIVSGGVLYEVAVGAREGSTVGSMALSAYNLEAEALIRTEYLLRDYDRGIYGGVLVGSAELPQTVQNNTIYTFASTNQVFLVGEGGQVETYQMEYNFPPLREKSNPKYTDKTISNNFTALELKVEEDGKIYALAVCESETIALYRFEESGFQRVWQTPLPGDWPEDMGFNAFEILGNL